jgi:hypothetical protein
MPKKKTYEENKYVEVKSTWTEKNDRNKIELTKNVIKSV